MNTILVPLDGSARAEQVLPYVRRLAPLLDAKLYLVQVVPETHDDDPFAMTVAEAYQHGLGPTATQRERAWHSWELQRRHAEGYLEAQAIMLQPAGVRVDFTVRLGDPAEEIIAVAEEQRATLIALATHGYSGLKRWTLGSVTDKVVHAAPMPVFIIRSAVQPPADHVAFTRILVPLDGSPLAQQALPLATTLATRAPAELTLIEAISPVIESYPLPLGQPLSHYRVLLPALRAKATDDLTSAAQGLRAQGLRVQTLVEDGYPAELIVDTADQRASDLIVMATHGYGGIRRWVLGSVADKVLHAATTPLLLVRARNVTEA
jgi:nucleotide-binding universal stress UspA family protein